MAGLMACGAEPNRDPTPHEEFEPLPAELMHPLEGKGVNP